MYCHTGDITYCDTSTLCTVTRVTLRTVTYQYYVLFVTQRRAGKN